MCNPLLRTIWGHPRNEAENQLDDVDNLNKLISLTERFKSYLSKRKREREREERDPTEQNIQAQST